MDGLNIPTGENVQEVAEPVVTDNASEQTADSGNQQTAAEVKEPQSQEVNAQFAAARRKAEEDAANKINGINSEFKRLFGNITNPVSGKKIETYSDYLQAVEYQQKQARDKMFQDKGIDPSVIEQMINSNPAIVQAQKILEENTKVEATRQLEADLKIISGIAPEIKTMDDLANHPSCELVVGFVEKGLGLVDAFKLANFDGLTSKKTEAAKQAAINQTKSKDHMEPTNSISQSDNSKDIPLDQLPKWQAFFPDASMKELKEKYNRVNK